MQFTWGIGPQSGAGRLGGTWGRRQPEQNMNPQTGQMPDGSMPGGNPQTGQMPDGSAQPLTSGSRMTMGSDNGMGNMRPLMGGGGGNSYGAPNPDDPETPAQHKPRFGFGTGGGISFGGNWGRQ